MKRAQRFLDAYHRLESELRSLLHEDETTGFKQLVRQQSERKLGPVRTHKKDLLEFADLRNHIVHSDRKGGRVIADPRPEVVEKMAHILETITDPPNVIPPFAADVTTVRREEPVSRVVRKMQERNYSQVPIEHHGRIDGVLTTNTIARWAGANVENDAEEGEILLAGTTAVEAVQAHAERENNYKLLSRDATLYDAADAFQIEPDDYGPIDATLITETGDPEESLLGIITMADLPAIHEVL